MKVAKEPGPDHPIDIQPNPNRVVVRLNDRVIAETTRALTLREATLPPVHYIPRSDVDMRLLERTARATYCPYKGDCAYYTVTAGDRRAENAVWSYEAPYDAVAAIKNHLAFYTKRVDSIEEHPRTP